ncbi:hypothetical protein HD554DRAFT_2331831 [Boletus coccyginus]|nr:hypothetical protein HD554DRAFT_2331831 [Boletus coccyginus]
MGKCKLKREGAIYFGPSMQKKTKTNHLSGLTASDTYRRTHKDGKPADVQHESHIEVQTGSAASLTSRRRNGNLPGHRGPIAITKIVTNAPQECLQHSTPIANAMTTRNRPSHQNLPKGSATQFTKFFIPLLRLYCGTLENPWMVPDRFVDKLQELWDKVMLDWPYWFDKDDDVYRLCMQKIYEWRTHIGKAGTEAVEVLWALHPKYENPEERKAYVNFALGRSLPFMYGSVEYLGANEYRVHPFQVSDLVLQTFASHIRDVSVVDNDTYHNLLDYAMLRGALVLAVTSVERALTLYSTGVKEVPTKRQVQVSYDVSAAGEINMDDDRALIVVSSDIEAESDGEGKPFIAQMYTSLIACHYWTVPGGETA